MPYVSRAAYLYFMSLLEVRSAKLEWTARGMPWGEAVLVTVRRSAPRPPGARFAVAADGSMAGTISAGCVEADLREHVLGAIADRAPRWVTYGITDEMALTVGLSCGGEIGVLVHAIRPDDPVEAELDRILESGAVAALVTGVAEPVRGQRLLLQPDGRKVGTLGDPSVDEALMARAHGLLATEGSRLLNLEDGMEVFIDPLLPPRRLIIVGATPAAEALARMAALADFRVVVVEPRPELARAEVFPDATLVRDWPADALSSLDLDPWTAVAVLAHDERLDVPALRAALEARCGYVGLLGGRRTQRLRRQSLEEAGLDPEDADRIRGPIGLDIGASTPAEIAVSVLAEVVATRRGATAGVT